VPIPRTAHEILTPKALNPQLPTPTTVTTPVPYQYLHMLNVLLFFFVYSVPFVFTANFKWVTPFPRCGRRGFPGSATPTFYL
jgi:hypothetical protein